MPATTESLLAAFRARGCRARDLRDGAHEATHALDKGLPPPWTRSAIHDAVSEDGVERALRSEVLARAVERIVCAGLGEPVDPEGEAMVAFLEFNTTFRIGLDFNTLLRLIDQMVVSPEAAAMAERVLALGEEAA